MPIAWLYRVSHNDRAWLEGKKSDNQSNLQAGSEEGTLINIVTSFPFIVDLLWNDRFCGQTNNSYYYLPTTTTTQYYNKKYNNNITPAVAEEYILLCICVVGFRRVVILLLV